MSRSLVLCVVALCAAVVVSPDALGQASRASGLPGGLTAADWAGIATARGEADAQTSGTIRQQAYLKASNPEIGDNFGRLVAVSGDTVVVGAEDEDSSATGVDGDQTDNSAEGAGAVYVFVRSGTSWSQQAYLKASNAEAGDRFGAAVAVSGDTVVVGAPYEDSSATGVNGDQADNGISLAGAAYVFVRNGTSWSQQAYLKASNTGDGSPFGDEFGGAVAVSLSGDTVVVGADSEDSRSIGVNGDQSDNNAPSAGAAYVFVRSGTNWSQQAYLKASNTDAGDLFGRSVSMSGDTAVIGASGEGSGATGVNGDQSDNNAPSAGAVYVFVRSGTAWSQQAYIKASNTETFDSFGGTLAVSGQMLVVGAQHEDSNATGVDGDQIDNSAKSAGAAYVFVRIGTGWSQQAYLKASNTDATDSFAGSVSISSSRVIVGAAMESSRATGVDGDQDNNDTAASGAAYAFVRNGTSWSQQAFLKASNTGSNDRFGSSVALSGGTAVIGAEFEDSNASGVNGNQSDDSATNAGAAYVFDFEAWTDMGSALAGGFGDPELVGTGTLANGSSNAVDLYNAAPSATCGIFVALSSTPSPFKGGTLLPFPPLIAPIILATSPAGTLPLSFSMPPGLPPGTDLWLQYAIQDGTAVQGFALSNAIVGTTP